MSATTTIKISLFDNNNFIFTFILFYENTFQYIFRFIGSIKLLSWYIVGILFFPNYCNLTLFLITLYYIILFYIYYLLATELLH